MTEQKKMLSKEESIAQYATGVEQLQSVLADLSEEQLDLARAEGKWTIRQIVHHIVDAEEIWKMIIKAALGNPGCTFDMSWYIIDNKCAEPLLYNIRPISQGLDLFIASRRQIVELLTNIPDAWNKSVTIVRSDLSEGKTLTAGEVINWQVPHLQLHINQIRETREEHGL